jgi:hypothetical protein
MRTMEYPSILCQCAKLTEPDPLTPSKKYIYRPRWRAQDNKQRDDR